MLYSTVELRLYQTDVSIANLRKDERQPLFGRAADALRGTLNALSMAFQWLFIFLAGALPVLIGAGLILAVLFWLRRSRRGRREEASVLIREANRQREKGRSASGGPGSNPDSGEEDPGEAPQAPEPPERK